MKPIIIFILLFLLGLGSAYYFFGSREFIISPLGIGLPIKDPLKVYTFEQLHETSFVSSTISIDEQRADEDLHTSETFHFKVPEKPGQENTLMVSGLMNVPKAPGEYPIIIMFRGYSDKETYHSGVGTQPSASVFASHGFITLAPDFLGYGSSASPSADPFEERFQTYTTGLTLLASLPTLNTALSKTFDGTIKADMTKIGIWGHSNGGHIALSVLAISGVPYPTVLWAPVSSSFPFSILAYTDEADDKGKGLRKILSHFEETYDTEKFSPPNYYAWIKAPLQIHQGLNDHEVPYWWSDDLVTSLKKKSIDVQYLTYPGADHNLLPSGWSPAVFASINFYTKEFGR